MKILITGGSGFIGTNLVQYYLREGHEVLSLDIAKPKIESHNNVWVACDILDLVALLAEVNEFKPDYLIHMAANTGLEGFGLEDYSVNIQGVQNVIKAVQNQSSIKKAVFASTMLVCRAGYTPTYDTDYAPNTIYGESKIIGENLVRSSGLDCEWVIVRPSSIWGPWFGRTYREFFEMIMSGKFFNFSGKSSTKTYGFIGNVVHQLEEIRKSDLANYKTLYLGDYEPTNIKDWANELGEVLGKRIITIPRWSVWIAAKLGDILKSFGVSFPLNSFRFSNMTTDNVLDLTDTKKIAPKLPYSRLEGSNHTLRWMGYTNND